ncbi:putative dienelactone hydrolase [Nocardiopsis arvandica]|uniref:Putative dienelactone hydrolase n=1 Tax=Nocardiopsis sinuspersici TaxID=501010 RepID=A0A7Y9XH71_9ACTN|nr:acetylhydrolase [Nocardiopsis sinuspersici]NYH55613.1 putative dienelactone hydrolase [Nocardiopsis sinuspersici]
MPHPGREERRAASPRPPRTVPVHPLRAATTLVAAAALVLPVSLAAPASASAGSAPADAPRAFLPAPTGDHPVGTTDLHLVDEDREDVWVGGSRELMVTLWYPARVDAGRTAPYMTEAESAAMVAELGLDLPDDVLHDGVRTNSRLNMPPARTSGGFPLVVLSPGAGLNRTELSSLAEELASHGFVVAGVDHAHEAAPVEFPDGLVTGCAACENGDWALGAVNRAEDVSFLLDRLTGPDPAWRWSHVIDASRVGMAGHSWGGSATAETLRSVERVDAGINLDGPYYPPVLDEGLDKPLALIENDQGNAWNGVEEMWPRLEGWRQWIRLEGSGHSNGIDRGVLMEQLGLTGMLSPEQWRAQFGDLPVEHGLDLVRTYSVAFFDHHLRGGDQPLLEDPGSFHPELVVVDPDGA